MSTEPFPKYLLDLPVRISTAYVMGSSCPGKIESLIPDATGTSWTLVIRIYDGSVQHHHRTNPHVYIDDKPRYERQYAAWLAKFRTTSAATAR